MLFKKLFHGELCIRHGLEEKQIFSSKLLHNTATWQRACVHEEQRWLELLILGILCTTVTIETRGFLSFSSKHLGVLRWGAGRAPEGSTLPFKAKLPWYPCYPFVNCHAHWSVQSKPTAHPGLQGYPKLIGLSLRYIEKWINSAVKILNSFCRAGEDKGS